MRTVLFLSGSPLHTLWYAGLAAGPFRDAHCSLVQIRWRKGKQDFLLDSMLRDGSAGLIAEIKSMPKLSYRPANILFRGRRLLTWLTDYSRQRQPDYVITGFDPAIEFYAALRGAPEAVGAYVDDGWGTYKDKLPGVASNIFQAPCSRAEAVRSLIFRAGAEWPELVGASDAVREAWVMEPDFVHQKLATKELRPMETAWFRDPRVVDLCARAIDLAGLEPSRLESVGLVLLIPHKNFLKQEPGIKAGIERLAREYAGRGETVAYKYHPNSWAQELQLPEENCLEIPQRLPVEILSPWLSKAVVAGSMTSSLIFLPRLNPDIRPRALVLPSNREHPLNLAYKKLGIPLVDCA